MTATDGLLINNAAYASFDKFTDDEFKASIQQDTGIKPESAAESFADLETDVGQWVARIMAASFIPRKDLIRGFSYEVETGRLR